MSALNRNQNDVQTETYHRVPRSTMDNVLQLVLGTFVTLALAIGGWAHGKISSLEVEVRALQERDASRAAVITEMKETLKELNIKLDNILTELRMGRGPR